MAIPLIPDSFFPPARTAPCYCGSGERFKNCCGAISDDRPPPFGVNVAANFLPADQCRDLLAFADTKPSEPFKVRKPSGEVHLDPSRVCEFIQFGEDQHVLDSLVARAFAEFIIPGTGVDIEWYEEPQLLKYHPGGFYFYHADSGYLVPSENAWRKAVDRDLSMLLYLKDDFEGGELHFKRLNYSLKPKAGMLVWFPSDVRYEHMARPVTSGTRYAIVSWAAAVGVERVQAERVNRAIDWSTREKKR